VTAHISFDCQMAPGAPTKSGLLSMLLLGLGLAVARRR
jgi:MYXO-CTERM domain-containing protein